MRPPRGYGEEKFPLRHRLVHSVGLSMGDDTLTTVCWPIVMSSLDIDNLPNTIQTNPHNSAFEQETGPLCARMSIIDRMRISLSFTMTDKCQPAHLVSGTAGPNFDDGTYAGEDIPALRFLWRPIFNVYPEKLDAADDDTTNTVATILGLTKDATNEDVVPLTTNKLISSTVSDTTLPMSSVNAVQVFGDYNMTTNTIMEDHVFDEDLLQEALRRYTNKGALRSCLGRTRHVTLTRARPYKNFYIDKFVPNAVRRIQKYGFFAIQIHLYEDSDVSQHFISDATKATSAHLGIQMITNYHEWHNEHDYELGTPA